MVGTGFGKDAPLDAGCSTAASGSCATRRHRDHRCLCRISYWVAEGGDTIYRLACEPGRNVPFKTALWGFHFQWWLPSYHKEGESINAASGSGSRKGLSVG